MRCWISSRHRGFGHARRARNAQIQSCDSGLRSQSPDDTDVAGSCNAMNSSTFGPCPAATAPGDTSIVANNATTPNPELLRMLPVVSSSTRAHRLRLTETARIISHGCHCGTRIPLFLLSPCSDTADKSRNIRDLLMHDRLARFNPGSAKASRKKRASVVQDMRRTTQRAPILRMTGRYAAASAHQSNTR